MVFGQQKLFTRPELVTVENDNYESKSFLNFFRSNASVAALRPNLIPYNLRNIYQFPIQLALSQ